MEATDQYQWAKSIQPVNFLHLVTWELSVFFSFFLFDELWWKSEEALIFYITFYPFRQMGNVAILRNLQTKQFLCVKLLVFFLLIFIWSNWDFFEMNQTSA